MHLAEQESDLPKGPSIWWFDHTSQACGCFYNSGKKFMPLKVEEGLYSTLVESVRRLNGNI